MSQLLQNALKWVRGSDTAASINGDGIIEVFAWETEPGYALHLLNYTNPNMTHGAIRRAYAVGPQQVRFRVSRGRSIKSVRELRSGTSLGFHQQAETVTFKVSGITDYEVIALT